MLTDDFEKAEAWKTTQRLIGINEEVISAKGHIRANKAKLENMELINELTDKINRQLIWKQKYETVISQHGNDIATGYRCYTDGSKTSY